MRKQYDTILHELEVLPEKLERVLASIEDVKYFASRYFNHDSIFFIGRNLDYATMSHPYHGLNELRELFLKFFETKGHLRLPSFRWYPRTTNPSC